jgi:hypothetical protein
MIFLSIGWVPQSPPLPGLAASFLRQAPRRDRGSAGKIARS